MSKESIREMKGTRTRGSGPLHRGGRHLVQVRCDQTYCHECGKELEKFRINFTAGFIVKMSLA